MKEINIFICNVYQYESNGNGNVCNVIWWWCDTDILMMEALWYDDCIDDSEVMTCLPWWGVLQPYLLCLCVLLCELCGLWALAVTYSDWQPCGPFPSLTSLIPLVTAHLAACVAIVSAFDVADWPLHAANTVSCLCVVVVVIQWWLMMCSSNVA
jgi:hypothetical protein